MGGGLGLTLGMLARAMCWFVGCTSLALTADRAHAETSHGSLHFSHPLVSESPSPDTKLRLDYVFFNESQGEGKTHTARLEGEFAFAPWISLELDAPYTFRDPDGEPSENHLDTIEVGVKLATQRFADHGLLFGGGLELGLPTGDDSRGIGSNNVLEIEPFVDFGWKFERWEVVGFLSAGVLHNQESDDADYELGWNLSALYHLHPRLQLLLELDGEEIQGGEEDGHTVVNLSPGLKLRPLPNQDLWLGLGVGFPLTSDKEFDARAMVSAFWHF